MWRLNNKYTVSGFSTSVCTGGGYKDIHPLLRQSSSLLWTVYDLLLFITTLLLRWHIFPVILIPTWSFWFIQILKFVHRFPVFVTLDFTTWGASGSTRTRGSDTKGLSVHDPPSFRLGFRGSPVRPLKDLVTVIGLLRRVDLFLLSPLPLLFLSLTF